MRAWGPILVAFLIAGCGAVRGSDVPSPSTVGTPGPSAGGSASAAVGPTAAATPTPSATPAAPASPSPVIGTWVPSGHLAEPVATVGLVRAGPGDVLVAAYETCPQWATPYHIEVGDPKMSDWRQAAGPKQPELGGAIVGLLDGRALFVGGGDVLDDLTGAFVSGRGTMLYDSATGGWSRSGSLGTGRIANAVALPGGGALIVGGRWSDGKHTRVLASAEAWDPTTGRWSASGQLSKARINPALVVLADGRVLAVGGEVGEIRDDPVVRSVSTDVFDPLTRQWTSVGKLPDPDASHVIALQDGGALAIRVSAYDDSGEPPAATDAVYRWDPVTGQWSPVPELVTVVRAGPAVVSLRDGLLLAVGSSVTRLYSPVTGTLETATPFEPGHTPPLLLSDGSVLVAAKPVDTEEDSGCVTQPGTLWRYVPG